MLCFCRHQSMHAGVPKTHWNICWATSNAARKGEAGHHNSLAGWFSCVDDDEECCESKEIHWLPYLVGDICRDARWKVANEHADLFAHRQEIFLPHAVWLGEDRGSLSRFSFDPLNSIHQTFDRGDKTQLPLQLWMANVLTCQPSGKHGPTSSPGSA